jgi:hypothetical protein
MTSVACVGGPFRAHEGGGPDKDDGHSGAVDDSRPALEAIYHPDRRDYASFREAYSGLLEPNYLPFMVHRFSRNTAAGEALVFCRWAEDQMPIPVVIETPHIPEALQDEFNPIDPAEYVEAADDALAVWQAELEGLVRFERVDAPGSGRLAIELKGERAPVPVPDRQRLGRVEALVDSCRASGWDRDAERMRVRFELTELEIQLADDRGLLPPTIVRRLVIHELGHALGMRGHSPSPGDVMYPVLKDSPGRDELSLQDVNSFVTLYRLPNGAHLVDLPDGDPPPRPPPAPPTGAPDISMSPFVDTRSGFEIQVPTGWLTIEEPHGVFVTNGPSWDYDVSLRIFVWPSPTIEDFLACCSGELLADSWFRHRSQIVVNGRRALKLLLEDAEGEHAQELLFVELGDGRVMLVIWEVPVEFEREWQPWRQACLNTLEIWD